MLIDGRAIAEKIFDKLKKEVSHLKIKPHLAVILVGNDPASQVYVRQKEKKTSQISGQVTVSQQPTDISHEELVKVVEKFNQNPAVHGIIIQRPLPPQIDKEDLACVVNLKKDVDGFHPDSFYPMPVAAAVMEILKEIYYLIDTAGGGRGGPPSSARRVDTSTRGRRMGVKPDRTRQEDEKSLAGDLGASFTYWLTHQNIAVIGKGETAGQPTATAFKKMGATPKVIDSQTHNPGLIIKQADIIISCVGKADMVRPEMIKKGVILIGVGLHRDAQGKLVGDYDQETIKDIASFYTPIPGGVGPVNVSMLLANLVSAAKKSQNN